MSEYLAITIILGIPNFIKLLTGVIKNKVIALFLGTEGLGIVSMGSYAINTLIPLSTLGSELSVVKYSAESKTAMDAHKVLFTGISFTMFNSLILCAFLIIFKERLSLWIFMGKNYLYAIFLIIVAFPFYSFCEILVHYLKGRRSIASIALGNSIISILSLSIAIPLIYFFKTEGGFLQILVTGIISFIILSLFIFREQGILNSLKKISVIYHFFGNLVKAGFLFYFLPRIFYILTLFLVKIMIVKNFDFKSNGIYESVVLLSVVIFSFLSDVLMGYFLPTVCNNMKMNERNSELNKAIRFIILTSVPTIIIVITYIGRFLIKILFSKQFLSAFEFLPLRFIGDYFFLINSAITFIFVANSNYRAVLSVSLIYNGLVLLLSLLFPIYLGFTGYFVAYLISTLLVFMALSLFLKKQHNIYISTSNYKIILFSCLLMVICFLLAQNKYLQLITIPLLFGWLFITFTIKELKGYWDNLLGYIKVKDNIVIPKL